VSAGRLMPGGQAELELQRRIVVCREDGHRGFEQEFPRVIACGALRTIRRFLTMRGRGGSAVYRVPESGTQQHRNRTVLPIRILQLRPNTHLHLVSVNAARIKTPLPLPSAWSSLLSAKSDFSNLSAGPKNRFEHMLGWPFRDASNGDRRGDPVVGCPK
jgi:hypothetical protein